MSISDLISFLEKHKGKEFTTGEIAEITKISDSVIRTLMRKLKKDPFETLVYRELTQEEKAQRFGVKNNLKILVYHLE